MEEQKELEVRVAETEDKKGKWNPTRYEERDVADMLDSELTRMTTAMTPLTYWPERDTGVTWGSTYRDDARIPFSEKMDTFRAVKKLTGHSGEAQVVIPLTETDTANFAEKRKKAELAQMDAWVAKTYASASPAERENLRRIYPQYFENKLKVVHDMHAAQEELAGISIRGPQSLSDLIKVYTATMLGQDMFSQIGPLEKEEKENTRAYIEGVYASLLKQKRDALRTEVNAVVAARQMKMVEEKPVPTGYSTGLLGRSTGTEKNP